MYATINGARLAYAERGAGRGTRSGSPHNSNLLLIHGAFEQSLGRFPVGLFVGLDEGKVGLARDDISFDHLRHSYSAGITIHAGGLPVVYVVFAWGGNEGHHIMGKVDTSLLGPGSRPSLF